MITEKQATSVKDSAASFVEGIDWDDATIGAAVKIIDVMQAIIMPWVKRLSPTLGGYIEIGLQTIEDMLRKMLPPTTASTNYGNPLLPK